MSLCALSITREVISSLPSVSYEGSLETVVCLQAALQCLLMWAMMAVFHAAVPLAHASHLSLTRYCNLLLIVSVLLQKGVAQG